MSSDSSGQLTGPLRKSVVVELSVEDSFHIFTTGIAGWWPLASHSISQARAVGCAVEHRVGGELYEETDDGRRLPWGKILVWDPPGRLVFTWHPGRNDDTAQEVEITFKPTGHNSTLVELEHRGWAVLGDKAEETRAGYDKGWDLVLGKCYLEGTRKQLHNT